MAKEVIWTHEAISDLDSITTYLQQSSSSYASSFVQKAFDTARSLNTLYLRGRVVPELKDTTIRELFVKEYRLIYRVEESQIAILTIIHQRRDLKKL